MPLRSPTVARLALFVTCASVSLALLWPELAHACSCMKPPPPQEAADQAVAVFEGTVLSRREEKGQGVGQHVFTMQVDRAIKGELPADGAGSIDVRTADNSAACGRPFEVGQRYLVYAYAQDEGALLDNACSRTMPADKAAADLAALEDYTPGASQPEPEPEPEPEPKPEPDPVYPIEDPPPPEQNGRGCALAAPGPAPTGASLLLGALFLGLGRRRSSH